MATMLFGKRVMGAVRQVVKHLTKKGSTVCGGVELLMVIYCCMIALV